MFKTKRKISFLLAMIFMLGTFSTAIAAATGGQLADTGSITIKLRHMNELPTEDQNPTGEGITVPGADTVRYKLYRVADYNPSTGTFVNGETPFTIEKLDGTVEQVNELISAGTTVEIDAKTNSPTAGEIKWEGLPLGRYLAVQEKRADGLSEFNNFLVDIPGYSKGDDGKTVKEIVTDIVVYPKNAIKFSELTIKKEFKDAAGGAQSFVAGAKVTIESITNKTGNVIENAGSYYIPNTEEPKGIQHTIPEGGLTLTDIMPGKYVIREVEAPEGYTINKEPIHIDVQAGADEKILVSYGNEEVYEAIGEDGIVTLTNYKPITGNDVSKTLTKPGEEAVEDQSGELSKSHIINVKAQVDGLELALDKGESISIELIEDGQPTGIVRRVVENSLNLDFGKRNVIKPDGQTLKNYTFKIIEPGYEGSTPTGGISMVDGSVVGGNFTFTVTKTAQAASLSFSEEALPMAVGAGEKAASVASNNTNNIHTDAEGNKTAILTPVDGFAFYDITVNLPGNFTQYEDFKITDTPSQGIKFNSFGQVYVIKEGKVVLLEDNHYSVAENVLTLTQEGINFIGNDATQLVVKVIVELDTDTIVDTNEFTNSVTVDYTIDGGGKPDTPPSNESTDKMVVGSLDINKTLDKIIEEGASDPSQVEFAIKQYKTVGDGQEEESWLTFEVKNGVYIPNGTEDTRSEANVIKPILTDGQSTVGQTKAPTIKVYGLAVSATDTEKVTTKYRYELHEIKAPTGYNPITKGLDIELTVAAPKAEMNVVNKSGIELPVTGGMGIALVCLAVTGLVVIGRVKESKKEQGVK